MSDLIGIEVEGITEIQTKLAQLPDVVAFAATGAVADYLTEQYKKYPAQNYVSRVEAYGVPFFTDRQRRWFFWALGEGLIDVPYNRTGTLAEGWESMPFGTRDHIVVNAVDYAAHVMGDGTQSRHEAAVGWKTPLVILAEKWGEVKARMVERIRSAIRGIGL